MRKWIFIIMISVIIWACGENEIDSSDPVALYKKVCVNCHGANGELAISGAKKFSESTLNVEERIQIITNGRSGTGMVSYANRFSPEEIRAIAEYTIQLTNNAKGSTK